MSGSTAFSPAWHLPGTAFSRHGILKKSCTKMATERTIRAQPGSFHSGSCTESASGCQKRAALFPLVLYAPGHPMRFPLILCAPAHHRRLLLILCISAHPMCLLLIPCATAHHRRLPCSTSPGFYPPSTCPNLPTAPETKQSDSAVTGPSHSTYNDKTGR